jgi:replicative superfamily II helicase
MIPEIVRNNSNINFVNYNKLNIKNEELPIINENITLPSILESMNKNENKDKDNKENKITIGIINEKIENIILLMKDMKEIDKKLKKKDLNKILNNYILNLKE